MTLIIGYKFGDQCFMAADNQTTSKVTGCIDYIDTKIIQHKNILIGITGNSTLHTYIENELTDELLATTPFEDDTSVVDTNYKYVMSVVIPAIINICNNRKLTRKSNKDNDIIDGSILIAAYNDFYLIYGDFKVIPKCCRDNSWICLGTNTDSFADGMLHGLVHLSGLPTTTQDVKDLMVTGLQLASKVNAYVGLLDSNNIKIFDI